MTISRLDLDERTHCVQRARAAATFLDAVFLRHFYNRWRKRRGPGPRPADIEPGEVFAAFREEDYQGALRQAQSLHPLGCFWSASNPRSRADDGFRLAREARLG